MEGVESTASLDVITPVVLAESNSHPISSEVIHSFMQFLKYPFLFQSMQSNSTGTKAVTAVKDVILNSK